MSCTAPVFKDHLSNCQDTITVFSILEPATTYKWVITDKFGKEYSGEAQTDGDGHFEIDVDDLPAGLLNQYGGEFKLEVFTHEGIYGELQCQRVLIPMAKYYESIVIDVRGGTNPKTNIGCEFDCVSAEGGNSAVFPFTDAATVDIEWTNLLESLYGNAPTVQVYHETSPGVYQIANVSVSTQGSPIEEINIDNGGPATGYVLVS
jgi:hypothetical protein